MNTRNPRKRPLVMGSSLIVVAGLAATASFAGGGQDPMAVIGNVWLQDTTPGTAQAGHANIKGTFRVGQLFATSPNLIIPIVGNNTALLSGAVAASFSAASPDGGVAVRGTATSYSGNSVGVYGEARGEASKGVYGRATKSSGTTFGVYGESVSPDGFGGYFMGRGFFSGRLGIGTANPATALDVVGSLRATGLVLPTGAGAGLVLTSDPSGNASWQPSNPSFYVPGPGIDITGKVISIATGGVVTGMLADGAVSNAKISDVDWNKVTGKPDTYPPGGNAGGVLTGTYPNPGLVAAAGDLAGSWPNITVTRLQSRNVSNAAPSNGQILKWNGTAWAPADPVGLTLPFDGSANVGGAAFKVTNTSGDGLWGWSTHSTGRAVFGTATATSGVNFGGRFETASTSGIGVSGYAAANSGLTYGVTGVSASDSGRGVFGASTAASGNGSGGRFEGASGDGFAVYGLNTASSGWARAGGFVTHSASGRALTGTADAASGTTYGVIGEATSADGWAVWGQGRLGATIKLFNIDHPLDPANKYLLHYCAEGSEPLLIYSGTVRTDARAEAWVQLPEYFSAVCKDPRYQLTVVDDSDSAAFVLAKVARKAQGNRFKIRTSAPHIEVSWQVSGVRNDRYVQAYGAPVEVEKTGTERGKYLHPELYGLSPEHGIFQPGRTATGVTRP